MGNEMKQRLQAPFPYFGGKATVSGVIWDALGDVEYYLEPFCGSAAVTLGRPAWHKGKKEIINDADCMIANVWRAIKYHPDETAKWVDYPVSHADLIARQKYIIERKDSIRDAILSDADFCDPKIAGFWVWGKSCWISAGFCSPTMNGMPCHKVPEVTTFKGVFAERITKSGVRQEFAKLSERLKNVMILCGDWKQGFRTPTILSSECGIFFDPPYSAEAGRDNSLYTHEDLSVAHEVRAWCIEHENKCRIVLAGYDNEHRELEGRGWIAVHWKANGGYANSGDSTGKSNRHRERLWLSPTCHGVDLFSKITAEDAGFKLHIGD